MKSSVHCLILLWVLSFCLQKELGAQLWYLTRGLNSDEVAWAVDVDSAGFICWAVEEKGHWPFWYYNILLYKIAPDAQQVPPGIYYYLLTRHGISVVSGKLVKD